MKGQGSNSVDHGSRITDQGFTERGILTLTSASCASSSATLVVSACALPRASSRAPSTSCSQGTQGTQGAHRAQTPGS